MGVDEADRLMRYRKRIETALPPDRRRHLPEGEPVSQSEGRPATPCIDRNGQCVYFTVEEGNPACILESIQTDEPGTLRPISCRLFPIRLREANGLIFLDYEIWEECAEAWNEESTSLVEFLEMPLRERFGDDWYRRLEFLVRRLKAI